MLKFPEDVPGWLSPAEGSKLFELAAGRTVLEIGSHHGRSTICLAQSAAQVFALDWHRGDVGSEAWTLPQFLESIQRYGVSVSTLLGRTETIGEVLRDRSFDLVFIDGAHDYASVVVDATVARRVLRRFGVLTCHDWETDGVRRAVGEQFGEDWLKSVQHVDELCWGVVCD